MLWGWIDTLEDNYPCLPDDYTHKTGLCLNWDIIETLFSIVDGFVPSIADLMWIEAWNLRIGTAAGHDSVSDMPRTADIFYLASQQGIEPRAIPSIVEDDSWMYHTQNVTTGEKVMAPSSVCCVFVCKMWKAAGIFGDFTDDINCGEQTNSDDYQMNIFDSQIGYVQMTGEYTLSLNDYNTRDMYAHQNEHCESQNPDYMKSPGC